MNDMMTRRGVLRSAAALGATAAVGSSAEDKAATKGYFTGGELELLAPDAIKPKSFSTNISPDGLAMTVLFDSFTVTLGETDKALSATKVATLRIPFALPEGKRLVGFTQDVRGFAQKGKGSRLALVADSGGAAVVFEFPYEEEAVGGDIQRSSFTVDRREGGKDAVTVYAVNILLSVQRRSTKEPVYFALDSLDIETVLSNPDAPAPKRKPPAKKERPKKS
jgi:hypothetical protein